MRTQSIRRAAPAPMLLAAFLVAALALMLASSAAFAHAGHTHDPSGSDGRLPGMPDFRRVGETTYRFLPAKGGYEVRVPGQPPLFLHQDSGGEKEEGEANTFGETFWGDDHLPPDELAPICRSSGNRIVIVYSHRPGDNAPAPKEELRSIVRRMNWKIADQARRSSNGAREVRMATECDTEGNISIQEIVTPTSQWEYIQAATVANYTGGGQLFGTPKGGDAIKYLDFDVEGGPSVALGALQSNVKSRANPSATTTYVGMVGRLRWEYHSPIHELFHTLGAVQYGSPVPPFSNGSGHCSDGTDVMCYSVDTKDRCPADVYNFPSKVPIDCGYDTYFNTAPKSGTWLAEYWDVGGPEDPFLVSMPTQPPKAQTGKATSIRPTSAVLNGTVTPNADYAAFYFEYGTTASYGKSAPAPRGVTGFGANPTPVSASLTGLTQQTTYHYRVVAVNDAGEKGYGGDQVFETAIHSATLCKAAEENSLCTAENRYPAGTTVEADTYHPVYIHTFLVDVSCRSTLKAKTTATAGLPLPFTITSWTLSECNDYSETVNCTTTVQDPVEKGALLWGTGSQESWADNFGRFTLGGEGNESLRLKCTESLGLVVIDCAYEVALELTVQAISGYSEIYMYGGATLSKESGVCPGGSSLEVTYRVTSPEPLYVAYGGRGPTAITEAASAIGGHSATLEGHVNPQGLATKYHFEYDTAIYKEGEEAHGSSVPVPDEAIGSGTSDVEVSQAVSALAPNTVYHFRVVATNSIGTTHGEDQTFTTPIGVSLCKSNEANCAKANRYPSETELKASASTVTIATSDANITCASALEGKTTSEADEPLPVSISAWTLSGCKRESGNSCTAIAEHLPYSGSLTWGGGSSGYFGVGNGGSGQPGWYIKCGSILECTWAAEPSMVLGGGDPAHLTSSKTTLTATGGLACPTEASLEPFTQTVDYPRPAYVKRVRPAATLCSKQEAFCQEANRYAAETGVVASGETTLNTSITEIKCQSSSLSGKSTSSAASPLGMSFSTWTLAGCTRTGGNTCTATTAKLPYGGSMEVGSGGAGSLAVVSGGSGKPSWEVKCGSFLQCTFSFIEPGDLFTIQGGSPATLADNGALMKMEGVFCPAEATFKATYSVTSPDPLYPARVWPW